MIVTSGKNAVNLAEKH